MKIMIIEDDINIATLIENELQKHNYQTYKVTEFDKIITHLENEKPNIILLDLFLPIHNGYYWCQEIRKQSNIPIIIISSRSENMDIIMGVQFGADDYITKPFDTDILIAKIQAILRRTYQLHLDNTTLEYNNTKLDTKNMQLQHENTTINLTKTEKQILEELFKEKGGYVSREKLIQACWQSNDFISDNTLAVNINRLRKKLSQTQTTITTKKNFGYALQPQKNTENNQENENPKQ